jgi:hypothetical protein
VRKDIRVKFVVLAVVFIEEEGVDFPSDDNFSLAVQFAEIAEENGSDIIRV